MRQEKKRLSKKDLAAARALAAHMLHDFIVENPRRALRAIESLRELVSRLAAAEAESKRIQSLLETGSLKDFDEMAPVSGLTVLAVCANLTEDQIEKARQLASARGRNAAEARHGAPSGYRAKRAKVIQLWRTGEYKSKYACANAAADLFHLSVETARKALKGVSK